MILAALILMRHQFNITKSITETTFNNENDDIFFQIPMKHTAFIIHSIDNLIVSVNVEDEQEKRHFGFVGSSTRSFGIYFGESTGSINVHILNSTYFSFSTLFIPQSCSILSISSAPDEKYYLQKDGFSNETITPNKTICFWHSVPGMVKTFIDFKKNNQSETSLHYVSNDLIFSVKENESWPILNYNETSDEEDFEQNNSINDQQDNSSETLFPSIASEANLTKSTILDSHTGNSFTIFRIGKCNQLNASLNIDIESESNHLFKDSFHSSFTPSSKAQFIIDDIRFPEPIPDDPPQRPDYELDDDDYFLDENEQSTSSNSELTILILSLLGVCFVCVIIIVFCIIFICKKKKQLFNHMDMIEKLEKEKNDLETGIKQRPHIQQATNPFLHNPIISQKIVNSQKIKDESSSSSKNDFSTVEMEP